MIINILVIILMIIALSCLGYTSYYIVKTRAHDDDIEAKLLSATILIILKDVGDIFEELYHMPHRAFEVSLTVPHNAAWDEYKITAEGLEK